MHRKLWSENLKGRDHLKNLGADESIVLEWILEKKDEKFWTGCVWLRIWTNGGFL
jgi:hypothetical protein